MTDDKASSINARKVIEALEEAYSKAFDSMLFDPSAIDLALTENYQRSVKYFQDLQSKNPTLQYDVWMTPEGVEVNVNYTPDKPIEMIRLDFTVQPMGNADEDRP